MSKCGNPRVRAMLVEMVWRMHVIYSPTPHAASRKTVVVAIARQLAMDLWRIFTGAANAETFGMINLSDAA